MKKVLSSLAIATTILLTMSCTGKKDIKDAKDLIYIAPSTIQAQDSLMTPEVLLSLGRLSDPQLSPDGLRILYGVTTHL